MTKQRFQITTNPMSDAVAFDEKKKKYYIGIDLEDLLNELSDENGHLKEENKQLRKMINKENKKSSKRPIRFIPNKKV